MTRRRWCLEPDPDTNRVITELSTTSLKVVWHPPL